MSWRDPSTQLQAPEQHKPQSFLSAVKHPLPAAPAATLGMVSSRARAHMVQRLQQQGISNPTVLSAMAAVERHRFVDSALASRAYEDTALPIGFKQTISQPSVVASMVSLACEAQHTNGVWLEIGTGCGYQAAVMAQCAAHVCSVERIEGLHQQAAQNLNNLNTLSPDMPSKHSQHSQHITLCLGDGTVAWQQLCMDKTKAYERFDAIVVAAAGLGIAPSWLQQLHIGGCLVTPVQNAAGKQYLHRVVRRSEVDFEHHTLQAVQFVPLLAGTAYRGVK